MKIDELPVSRAWVPHRLEQGIPVYLNVKTQAISWVKPEEYLDSGLVSVQQFEDLVGSVVEDDSIEPMIIKLQACARGFLVRERIAMRLHHFHSNEDAVIKIQVL